MEKPTSVFVTFALLISFSIAIAGEPFAPKAALPSKGSEYFGLWEMRLSSIKVPDRASVGIPPYPGAKVIRFRDVGKRDLSGVRKTPRIFLITSSLKSLLPMTLKVFFNSLSSPDPPVLFQLDRGGTLTSE